MNSKKTTKRALLSSIVALFLCFAMLLGTTYAWFTDSVTSANNVITSGNLDIELDYATFNEDGSFNEWTTVQNVSSVLTNTLWEPGVTEVAYLRLKNAGSLALKYQLGINIVSETKGVNQAGEEFLLSDYIQFGVKELTVNAENAFSAYADRESAIAAVGATKKISEGFTRAESMLAGGELYLALVVYMPTSVGNDANHNGVIIPEIQLGINVVATQVEYEGDSFGSDYDNGAYIPVAPETVPESAADLILKGSAESKTTVIVPAAVVEGLDEEVTSVTLAASAPIVDTTNKTVTFTTVELLDQNGEEVDLSNATAKVTVKLYVGDVFAKDDQVEVYHDGALVTVATVDENGYITYEVSHFCEVSVKPAEKIELDAETEGDYEGKIVIETLQEFLAFAADVNAGNSYAGKTVVLGKDIDLAGVTWTPIGTSEKPFKGTFDGNGKVIKNLSVLMAGKSNVGLFGVTTDGEIKNVTVENAKIAGRLNVGVVAGTPYTSKYTNIKVTGHVEVDGMAYVGAVGGKNAYANWTDVTVDVDATSYVNANSVENGKAYRTYVGGVVGFNGEGAHTFKNITSNISVIGSTCDVGGAFGIAHYNNKFENVTVTGTVTCESVTLEIGGVAGVWHNENGTTVTFTNCVYNGESDVFLVGDAYNTTGTGVLTIDGAVVVRTADELVAALEAGKNVIMFNDIKIDPASMSNAYGTTGINVKEGQILDGNGHTLNVQGAGGTWDSGICTNGGCVVKNITITGSFRGIFIKGGKDPVVLDNVTTTGTVYTISCDQATKQGLVATNCSFNGWTSFAGTIGEATFENCYFGPGSGNNFSRPYAPTTYIGCTFAAGHQIDPRAAITLEGCTFNGVAVTAENLATLVTFNIANASVK